MRARTIVVTLGCSIIAVTALASPPKLPAKDFASETFCDRAIVWNPGAQKFDYAPVSTVRMVQ